MIPISLTRRLRLRDPLTFALYGSQERKRTLTSVSSPWGLLGPSSTQGGRETPRLEQNVSQEPPVLSEE